MTLVAGSFDIQLLWPFFGWLFFYVLTLMYFVPRLGRAAYLGERVLGTPDAGAVAATVWLCARC